MKQPSPSLTYRPAYIGLFASLFLAAVCNTFLDIQYGGFTFETAFWAAVFGATVRIGWRQRGEATEAGKNAQKTVLVTCAIMSVLIFIPMWGFPRAGLAVLAMLQAAQNCVTVTRRQLHMGLLVSAVMVMFAASHYRADWTMLFYLVPYITAVVFTLVAEQISRRAQDMRKESLGVGSTGGQGAAIAAAASAILLGGAVLYTITPQVTWPYLFWRFGQPGNIGLLGKTPVMGQTGQQAGQSGGQGADGEPAPGGGDALPRRSGWPSPKDMHEAAKRKGMPQWQSAAIMQAADMVETAQLTLTPIQLGLDELWNDIKEWLKRHRQELGQSLMGLIILALLIASRLLLREARLGMWLRCRFDYLYLGLLRRQTRGNAGACRYYQALQRLMDLQGMARSPAANTREYLVRIGHRYGHLRREAAEMTLFFERARYGVQEISAADADRMREDYLAIYRGIGAIQPAMASGACG